MSAPGPCLMQWAIWQWTGTGALRSTLFPTLSPSIVWYSTKSTSKISEFWPIPDRPLPPNISQISDSICRWSFCITPHTQQGTNAMDEMMTVRRTEKILRLLEVQFWWYRIYFLDAIASLQEGSRCQSGMISKTAPQGYNIYTSKHLKYVGNDFWT